MFYIEVKENEILKLNVHSFVKIFREMTEDRVSMDITSHNFSSDWLTLKHENQQKLSISKLDQ